ncbi:hypothetical protein DAI22_05g237200 [Oryza sativa Japonica Group]|nr:hypothetical protein DAI22_05g237200 [Oryza sativa Japonica Group]
MAFNRSGLGRFLTSPTCHHGAAHYTPRERQATRQPRGRRRRGHRVAVSSVSRHARSRAGISHAAAAAAAAGVVVGSSSVNRQKKSSPSRRPPRPRRASNPHPPTHRPRARARRCSTCIL